MKMRKPPSVFDETAGVFGRDVWLAIFGVEGRHQVSPSSTAGSKGNILSDARAASAALAGRLGIASCRFEDLVTCIDQNAIV